MDEMPSKTLLSNQEARTGPNASSLTKTCLRPFSRAPVIIHKTVAMADTDP